MSVSVHNSAITNWTAADLQAAGNIVKLFLIRGISP